MQQIHKESLKCSDLQRGKIPDSKGNAGCVVNNEVCLIVDGRLEAVHLESLFSKQQRETLRLSVCDAKPS
jgi:hypothetical protein